MLDSTLLLPLARHLPSLFGGARLHRAALEAASRRRFVEADCLFERAARRYREELRVEPLARLRVHQSIVAIRCGRSPDASGEDSLEIERRLALLRRIESLDPPFDLVEARQLLANWREAPSAPDASLPRAA